MWFKNLFLRRIRDWTLDAAALESLLSAHPLQACGATDMESRGWLRPKGAEFPFVHAYEGRLLISFGTERRLLPPSVVDQYAKARADEWEEREGHRPGRKMMREIKEAVAQELLPRAFEIKTQMFAYIDPAAGWLVVNASSESKTTGLLEWLIKHAEADSFSFDSMATTVSPSAAMSQWLAEREGPAGFTVDRDCELRDNGEEKAAVRYVHHDLNADEIPAHIASGKVATKLALTWQDKVSFVLTDGLQIKKLAPLDVLTETAVADAETAADLFDADFALMSGELALLLKDLVAGLGGFVAPSEKAA